MIIHDIPYLQWSHIWMSHVTHMNESCHTYEWVMSQHDNTWYTIIYNDDTCHKTNYPHPISVQSAVYTRKGALHMSAKEPYEPYIYPQKSPFFACINVHHFLLCDDHTWYIIIYTDDTWQKNTLDTCNTLFCVMYHSIYSCVICCVDVRTSFKYTHCNTY